MDRQRKRGERVQRWQTYRETDNRVRLKQIDIKRKTESKERGRQRERVKCGGGRVRRWYQGRRESEGVQREERVRLERERMKVIERGRERR